MLLIPTLAYFTLRSARVQTYLAQKAATYLSNELGAQVNVGGVNLSWFLNLVLEDISIMDQKDQVLLYSKRMVFDVANIDINSKTLIVNKIILDRASIGISRYPGQEYFNFQFLIDSLKSQADSEKQSEWDIVLRSFEFKNAALGFHDHSNPGNDLESGFNYSHFHLANINLEIKELFWDEGALSLQLSKLSLEESGGFKLSNSSAEVHLKAQKLSLPHLQISSDHSRLQLEGELRYDSFAAFSDFANAVNFAIQLKNSKVSLSEIAYFIKEAKGLEGDVLFSGEMNGYLSNLRASDLHFRYGNFTELRGGFSATGLPDITETFLNISVDRLVTSVGDISGFQIPGGEKAFQLNVPDDLKTLGLVNFEGSFTGFYYDFVAFGDFNSDLGTLSTDLAFVSDERFSEVSYRGNISAQEFNVGKLTAYQDQIGKTSFSARLDGKGNSWETMDMNMEGDIYNLSFQNYDYKNLEVSGHLSNRRFNGNFLVDDSNAYLNFAGLVDFRNDLPVFNFTLELEDVNLTALNLYQRDSLYQDIISTLLTVDARGDHPDNIEGKLSFFRTRYEERPTIAYYNQLILQQTEKSILSLPDSRTFETGLISLENRIINENKKVFLLFSDFLDAQLNGDIYYDQLKTSLENFLSLFMPSAFDFAQADHSESSFQNFEFDLVIGDINELGSIFFPEIQIAIGTQIQGYYNSYDKDISIEANTDYAYINGFKSTDLAVSLFAHSDMLKLNSTASKFFLTDSITTEQSFFNGEIFRDTLAFQFGWDNKTVKTANHALLEGRAEIFSPQLFHLEFMPSYAFVNDSLWVIQAGNQIIYDSTYVKVSNLLVSKNNEFIKANGILSDKPEDVFTLEMGDFNLYNAAFLIEDKNLNLDGVATGTLELSNLKKAPNINANLIIEDFAFNHDRLGDLKIESYWDAELKAFRVGAEVIYQGNVGSNKPIIATGYIYPEREDDNFDLDIQITNLRLAIFARYLQGFASNVMGTASGSLRLDGPLARPELSGTARLQRTRMRIDYLNTTYSIADNMEIGKDFFRFDNIVIRDSLNNTAAATGVISHDNFFDFALDIEVILNNIAVMNLQAHHNELFYGRAMASGLVKVKGPVNNVVLDISGRTERGTQFFLPLDYTGDMVESSFISFVNRDEASNNQQIVGTAITGLTMNFDLEVTPESEVQIIFDNQIGDILRGRGSGNLLFEINSQGAFNMYGDYIIEDGDYLFTLQNLINKRFRIKQGGNIRWIGDPYNADIDIKAIYRTRTSLLDLARMEGDTSDVYRQRVPVETVLHLQDQLFNPSISFDIQIPGGDENIREMVERIITTEQEMNRQVFSLLILNRFMPPNPEQYIGMGLGSTSSELLSNQLTNWLSQISPDFDIGVNYRPGDEISSQEIEVALSRQFFNNRLIIDGNVGVAGNHPETTQRTSNFIGDLNVEWKITPEGKFRIRAFNRSNTFDVLNNNSPYTQGLGVFYRKEFDSLEELFKRQRKTIPVMPIIIIEEDEYDYSDIPN